MLDRFFVLLTNALYFVPVGVNNFKKKFPNAEVMIACATKGIKLEGDEDPQYNYKWSMARRNTLILAKSGLYCGDWEMPLGSIHQATLFKVPSGAVLQIKTSDRSNYQFGIQNDPRWEKQKILPLKVETKSLKFSSSALFIRAVGIALFVFFVAQDVVRKDISAITIVEILLVAYLASPIITRYLRP